MKDALGAAHRDGPMALDPRLDDWRLPESDCCWWCGAPATTMEHRIKHSTLRRVARGDDGTIDPANVYKKADDFEGALRSLKKGTQVKWRKNLCAPCNNARSQPFDLAYDRMESFYVRHADEMMAWERLRWADVYGENWEQGAADLARYFAKQVGCMLASQRLPVPADLIALLDGAERCPSVEFVICRNWRAIDMHKVMLRDGDPDGITSFVGLLPSAASQTEGRFSGVDYTYHIGYLWFAVDWREGTERNSWWEYPEIGIPLINASIASKFAWRFQMLRARARSLISGGTQEN